MIGQFYIGHGEAMNLETDTKPQGLMIDWEAADRITVLTLKNYRDNLQEHLTGGADGSRWLHPQDEVHNRAMIQAIDFVLNDFGGAY